MLKRSFKKEEKIKDYVRDKESQGFDFSLLIQKLFDAGILSNKYFESLELPQLEVLRTNLKGEIMIKIISKIKRKGDIGYWANSCLKNYEDVPFWNISCIELKKKLKEEKEPHQYYLMFLDSLLSNFSSFPPYMKEFIDSVLNLCFERMTSFKIPYADWKAFYKENVRIINRFSNDSNPKEVRIEACKRGEALNEEIKKGSLEFEYLVMIANASPELREWALEKIKKIKSNEDKEMLVSLKRQ